MMIARFDKMTTNQTLLAVAIMGLIIVSSNVLVQPQFHINAWLTWGAITYPVCFLVTDLLNRRFGPGPARRVVSIGFVFAVLVSYALADARIALASGSAFLVAQLLDIFVFDKLRNGSWWKAPFIAGWLAAIIDTFLFFAVAFAGTDVPWVTLATGDVGVKLAINAMLLAPFRILMWNLGQPRSVQA
ncbi:membrane protein [Advenella kashmirensis W13003]|uniref:Probable queuosine precursor transporter n=1 Tax=Advenella kashmirensis W13003 TaxID=1424334 RepID=V8QPL3_9BURK|nr:queuosine precursor transporter [Advenella kashmirensis]ETF01906.1 membrane protein [Advenella kashmirensis W13003]